MHWVLQANLYNEGAFLSLLEQLKRQDTTYDVVKIIPFIAEMEPDINPEGPVFVCGATAMSKIAARKGWTPGYFHVPDMAAITAGYGEHMLNAEAVIAPFENLTHIWDRFHLRPVNDGKAFAGTIFDWDELVEWRARVAALDGDDNSLTTLTVRDTVVMSPLKTIYSEFRFFVVEDMVITGSMYKRGDRVHYSTVIDPVVREFAEMLTGQVARRRDEEQPVKFIPATAYCLDIALTPDGPKVIEINSINSAGFYACDMGRFVAAINGLG